MLNSPTLMRRYGICHRMRISAVFCLKRDARAAPLRHNVNFAERCPQSLGKDRISFEPQHTWRNALGPSPPTLRMSFPGPVHGQYYHAVPWRLLVALAQLGSAPRLTPQETCSTAYGREKYFPHL